MDKDKQRLDLDEAAITVDDLVSKIMRDAALGSASLDGQVLPQPRLDESKPTDPAS